MRFTVMQPLTVTSPYEKCRVRESGIVQGVSLWRIHTSVRNIAKGRKTRNQLRRRKLIEQKVMGILLLAVCVMNIIFACNGKTVEDKDCTPILLFAPMGFYLLFTKQVVIY